MFGRFSSQGMTAYCANLGPSLVKHLFLQSPGFIRQVSSPGIISQSNDYNPIKLTDCFLESLFRLKMDNLVEIPYRKI